MPTIAADGIYYVDLGSDPDFSGGSFISIYPEDLAFDDEIRNIGNISFQISFSAKDQDGNIVISAHDVIGPWRTYFRLRYGNVAIMAGPVVSWNTKLGSDFISVFGKTWEVYFSRWMYPFDPRVTPLDAISHVNDFQHLRHYTGDELVGSGALTPTGFAYEASNRDVIRILSDIISETQSVPHRITFDLSHVVGLSGIKTHFELSLGDTSYMDSFINNLAGTGQGFDWWVSTNGRILYWATPFRFGNPATPTIIYTFSNSDLPDDLDFTNTGPAATHVYGTGAGLASQTTLARAYGYGSAQIQFSRLDLAVDFGDVRNKTQLISKTQRELSRDLQPQHEIPLSVDPSRFTNFWSTFRKGRAIYLDIELIAHRIDSAQQLVKYDAKMNEEGDVTVDFTLSQIYDLSYNAGSPEG